MPIYDFRCQECGKVSEFLLSSSSDSRTLDCPGCGSQHLERLISAPSLLKDKTYAPGTTCCGRTERCETPPCSTGKGCQRT
ncbi:zinc ribbon domain-containing protein [Chloroflexota bacterium]